MARGLVSQRSQLLGIISLPLNDPFRPELISAVEKEARASGYACLLGFMQEDMEDLPILIEQMLEHQVDGILLVSGRILPQPRIRLSVPCVTLSFPIQDDLVVNVDVDNVNGSYKAVCHLIGLGHRAIGIVGGPEHWQAAQDRLEGGRRALVEIGQSLPESWVERSLDWSMDSGYLSTLALLDRHPELTALFCHSDWLAAGAYRALSERGLTIPGHVSVIGYDDLMLCAYMNPALTSVHQPIGGIGELLVQMLITAIERGRSTSSTMLVKTELVVRASTAALSEPMEQVSGANRVLMGDA